LFETLITVLAYLKQIKLVEVYPDNFTTIVDTLSAKVV